MQNPYFTGPLSLHITLKPQLFVLKGKSGFLRKPRSRKWRVNTCTGCDPGSSTPQMLQAIKTGATSSVGQGNIFSPMFKTSITSRRRLPSANAMATGRSG